MKNRLTVISGSQSFKAGLLVLLFLIMLIPISMVKSLIEERSYRATEVKEEISSSAGGILQFSGPLVKLPGKRNIERIFINSDGKKNSEYHEEDFCLWISPKELDIDINLHTENKFRGIFYSPVFKGDIVLGGSFNLDKITNDLEKNERLLPAEAELIIPFFNQKGIREIIESSWDGEKTELYPGNRNLTISDGGIYSKIPLDNTNDKGPYRQYNFNFKIKIRGAENVSILPLGAATSARISADWPSPSFQGFCLPDTHDISEEGFTAEWNCNSLSSGLPVKWSDETVFSDYSIASSYIETDFINIHDHYEQNERAAKYAVLFIMIPFITLFMFEHFFKCRIHPIQYILAATANIIFYLLLLSLSEHISFNLSYLISSSAVTIMLCLYTFSALNKEKKAWYMTPVMISLYIFLFITLQSEDWALLIGSSGVFTITAFIMFITRKIDFYQSRQNPK